MDIAYDRVQNEALSPTELGAQTESQQNGGNLNDELTQAFKAVSSTQWGSRLGGWFSQARKQGESLYNDLQKEASEAQEQAARGFSSLREQVAQRTRGMSLHADAYPHGAIPGEEAVPHAAEPATASTKEASSTEAEPVVSERPESLPADIIKEAGSLVQSLRLTATARLRDLQAAEDAADEALLTFGSNVRDFLRNAVTITAPVGDDGPESSEVLFETSEPGTGRKVFHTTRLDAQLHAIHNAPASFTTDPHGEQFQTWKEQFDVEKQTDDIAADLEKHSELRRAMERLVPEKVDYAMFWTRYYFLRKAIEEEEKRRKEILKGAAADPDEEVTWDDEDEDRSATPSVKPVGTSTTTLHATSSPTAPSSADYLQAPRRSHEEENKSVADSDASYDMVSGATTRAAGSPKESKKGDDSDEEDWE